MTRRDLFLRLAGAAGIAATHKKHKTNEHIIHWAEDGLISKEQLIREHQIAMENYLMKTISHNPNKT